MKSKSQLRCSAGFASVQLRHTHAFDSLPNNSFYHQYVAAQQKLAEFDAAEEAAKSKKMYEAWKRQTEDKGAVASNHRSTGVAVVRTLASETKRKSKSSHDRRTDLENDMRELLDKAAHLEKHPQALLLVGNDRLADGKAQEALDYYQQAGELGLGKAFFSMGHCLWEGVPNILSPDRDEAMASFQKAVDLGDLDSMYFLGANILGKSGESGVDISVLQNGLELVEQAAKGNHGGAMHYLSLFYRNGCDDLNIPPCSQEQFRDRLDSAVCHDTTGEALFLRGSCQWSGDSYMQNVQGALDDFLRATDLGQSDAAVSAGAILHKGVPGIIPRDQQRAFLLYQRGGELGNVEGWRNVVACYATGEGVPQSTSMAQYISKLMLQGDSQSNRLGGK